MREVAIISDEKQMVSPRGEKTCRKKIVIILFALIILCMILIAWAVSSPNLKSFSFVAQTISHSTPGHMQKPEDSLLGLSGYLEASSVIPLPDIYRDGRGWTCTGLAYDAVNGTFLVGDIGKALPSDAGFASQLVRVSSDFQTVEETIPLYTKFPNMLDVQGVTIDSTDETIWFCSTSENLIRHIDAQGNNLGAITVSGGPTGISYSPEDDSFWVLTYANANNIIRISKTGKVIERFTFAYEETLDQCFLVPQSNNLYIVAGTNYSGRNNVYLFNTETHKQSIACIVDSYSVEGIWIGQTDMVILNDGYYHNAAVAVNQANIYSIN